MNGKGGVEGRGRVHGCSAGFVIFGMQGCVMAAHVLAQAEGY